MKTPHKHAELIKAWADGAEIEFRDKTGQNLWRNDGQPCWHLGWLEFRIKPEPKPDVVKTIFVGVSGGAMYVQSCNIAEPNIKLTFDGETGKLKSAEVL